MKEKAKKTREVREVKTKAEAKTVERKRAWSKAKAKEKAKIARIDAEAREKAKDEARVRVKTKDFQKTLVEAVSNIISIEEIKEEKRERGKRLMQGHRSSGLLPRIGRRWILK